MRNALILLAVLLLSACGRPQHAARSSLTVVTSFYPLYAFTSRVGGDRVTVQNLVWSGEAHDYEPTPQDVAALARADVIVYNGAGLEPWLTKVLPNAAASAIKVSATDGLPLVDGDPHVWVDPVLAKMQVERIRDALGEADPGGREAYEKSAGALLEDLDALDARFASALRECRHRTFIVSHAAFGYLARRYRLSMVALTFSPEAEPSPSRLRDVIAQGRQRGIRIVYYESPEAQRAVATVGREIGARLLPLNPLEGLSEADRGAGKDYFAVMDENLRHLAEGLECR